MTVPPASWQRCREKLQAIRAARGHADPAELLQRSRLLLAELRQLVANVPVPRAEPSGTLVARAAAVREALAIGLVERPVGADDAWEATVAPFRGSILSDALVSEFLQALANYTQAARASTAEVEQLRDQAARAARAQRLLVAYLETLREMSRCVCSSRGVTS